MTREERQGLSLNDLVFLDEDLEWILSVMESNEEIWVVKRHGIYVLDPQSGQFDSEVPL